MHFPGIKVINPSTPYDAKGLMLAAIRDPNPVCFVEHKVLYKTKGEVPEEDYTLPIGVAEIKRPGRDITVVANNVMVIKALSIAERLAKDGIEVEVIDPRTLLPLDTETIIQSVMRTGRLLVVHEACQTGGWAGEVIACVVGSQAFDYLDTPVRRLGGKDIPIPYNRILEKYAIPQDDEIEQEIRDMVEGKI
jgi:pyruvate dehydrogenase E1 component beta subunit